MICGVVSAKALVEAGDWRPERWLGPGPDINEEIRRAELQIERGQERLAVAQKTKDELLLRSTKLQANGVVTVLKE